MVCPHFRRDEASHEKEQRARETIQNLKSEITKLGRLVEQGADGTGPEGTDGMIGRMGGWAAASQLLRRCRT